LLAWVLEREIAGSGLRLARLTADLLRPVPVKPLAVRVQTLRAGRRLRLLEGVLEADGVVVSRACALYLEQVPLEVPEYARFAEETLPPPQGKSGNLIAVSSRDSKASDLKLEGLHTTVEVRLIDGVQGRGEGRVWMRLPVPVIANQPCSPTVQAATLADFGNGVAQLRVADGVGCINADVTLYLARAPIGEWIGFDAHARMGGNGNGLVETQLYDELGPFGRVAQATLAMPVYKKG
jgi:hypothetical protein